jgi:hypothetical protein
MAQQLNCIFTIGIPVHLPYSIPATKQRDLISQEYEKFQQKCLKHTQKRTKHQEYIPRYKETSFSAGNEPYLILEKDKPISWRGFLKLYKSNLSEMTRNGCQPIRSTEGAKLRKPGQDIPNLDQEMTEVNRIIQLFREEAFASNPAESRKQFSKKMQLTLLLNRVRSISATRNKSMKRYTEALDTDPSVLLIRAFWEPKWVKKNGARFIPVPFQEVRHFFLEYLQRNPKAAIRFLIQQEGDILGETLGGSVHVPYRQFREAIRVHPVKNYMVGQLRQENPGASLFESTHDSDLVQLRIQRDGGDGRADGLYSFYEETINNFHRVNDEIPPLITTGYRAAYDLRIDQALFPWLYVALEEDRYIRQATSRVDPAMTYYPEPNCVYYVRDSENSLPHSFLGEGVNWALDGTVEDFRYYDPSESKIIFHQVQPKVVLFDASHPVVMKLPTRMLLQKKSHSSFCVDDLGSFDNQAQLFQAKTMKALKVSENISQSPLSFRDLAVTIYNQLGFCGGNFSYRGQSVTRPDSLLKSLVPSIFNAWDPITFIESDVGLDRLTEMEQSSYEQHPSRRFKMKDDLKSGNDLVTRRLKKINDCSKFEDQKKKLRKLVDAIYGKGIFDKLYRAAEALGRERFQSIDIYFIQGVGDGRRSNPISAMQDFVVPTPSERVEPGEEEHKEAPSGLRTPPRVSQHTLSTPSEVSLISQVISPPESADSPPPFRRIRGRELFPEENHPNLPEENPPDFPKFSRSVFQQTLNRLNEKLGRDKDAKEALYDVFGFSGYSAFYSARNLKNKSNDTYERQWEQATAELPSFCRERNISLREILS